MKVPFLDLYSQHKPLETEFEEAFRTIIKSSSFAGGPVVADFEEDFARYCGAAHCVGMGSGTDALWLALLACGVGPGDEVITVSATFAATVEAIVQCGATPRFVDIREEDATMDPSQLESQLTDRTRAIIPVHLYGQPADMDPILAFARKHGLLVIEDAAQAHGAEYKGRKAGTLGDIGCFSFYPGKNLGAFGDAGATVTNDPAFAAKMRALRDHGQTAKYDHEFFGWNARMDGIQAAVLKIKLRSLNEANSLRRAHAAAYDEELAGLETLELPRQTPDTRHVYHIYAVRVFQRDDIQRHLAASGIDTGIHYPVPVHLQRAYSNLGYSRGSLPATESLSDETLSLPLFPGMTSDQIGAVVDEVRNATSATV